MKLKNKIVAVIAALSLTAGCAIPFAACSSENPDTDITQTSTYTVTFEANGYGETPSSQSVEKDGKVTEPSMLTVDGYTFGGWYKEADCATAWDFNMDTVTADITLYAKWVQISSDDTNTDTDGADTVRTFDIDYTLDSNSDEYAAEKQTKDTASVLNGKTIYWMGSSVIYGSQSNGVSVANYVSVMNGVNYKKDAVSSSTFKGSLTSSNTSYVYRTVNSTVFDKNEKIDAFVCQISTNDAGSTDWGSITDSDVTDRSKFDNTTTLGAVEYIISYVHDTWNCPIYFMSGSYFNKDGKTFEGEVRESWGEKGAKYGQLVNKILEVAEKWNKVEGYEVDVINMYYDDDFNNISQKDYAYFMATGPSNFKYTGEGIHPRRAGYLYWWTPYVKNFLETKLGVK